MSEIDFSTVATFLEFSLIFTDKKDVSFRKCFTLMHYKGGRGLVVIGLHLQTDVVLF